MAEYLKIVLEFLSSLAWPVAVVVVANTFRDELARLIDRISHIKYPGGEVTTQLEDPEAVSKATPVAKELKLIEPSGFYSKEGLTQLVQDSGFMGEDERVAEHQLIFRTLSQRTWFVATNRQLFCILDDETTRSKQRLIQWDMALGDAEPIHARMSERGNHVIDVGKKRSWLYSTSLHPDPPMLEADLRSLITRAASAS